MYALLEDLEYEGSMLVKQVHYKSFIYRSMCLYTSQLHEAFGLSMWGDIFCIKWFSKWISIPVSIFPYTRSIMLAC
jgi:hypothetical protein